MDKLSLQQAIYYGSYLVFPAIGYFGFRLWRGGRNRWVSIALLGAALLFTWARFVEPQIILVHEHRAKVGFPARIALISDLHLGLYKGAGFLERLVERLNGLEVEVVLIAGDLTHMHDRPLAELFAPLRALRHKAYAVRGNHDSEMPGPPIERELREALAQAGVRLLENETVRVGSFVVAGLGDMWAARDDVQILRGFKRDDNVVVLMHNPDTSARLPPGLADVALAGHTHGGQIRIPWLYRKVIPTEGPFDRGWHDLPSTRVFVTSGVGESGPPFRLLVPPVIDVIVLE